MASNKKTDNHDPRAKLALRRHFLARYHGDGSAHVLDCCSGSGFLWGRLRAEFQLASYWGVDLKAKKGRLKLDSVRILSQPGWPQNVVDIDTYGSPWKHWLAMLPNLSKPTTVFITLGRRNIAEKNWSPKNPDQNELDALGVSAVLRRDRLPFAVLTHFAGFLTTTRIDTDALLARTCDYGITIIEAVESVAPQGATRYIGLRLAPTSPTLSESPI